MSWKLCGLCHWAVTALGAFRADVSGAGPAVYGLFPSVEVAERAVEALEGVARTWVTRPAGSQGPATVRS